MERAYDLVIRGGRGLRRHGRRAGFEADVAVKDGRIAAVGEIAGAGRRGDRRARPDRHAGLRRHPHPLRRPGDLGRAHAALVLARRHHGGDGQLRRRLRALPAGRPRPAGPADGGRRGHSLPGADRGPAVELGELSRLSGRAWPSARFDVDIGSQLPHAALRVFVMGERGRRPRAGHRGRHRRHGRASPSGRWRPARWASPPRAPSTTAPATAQPIATLTAGEDELTGIAMGLAAAGKGVLQVVSDFADEEAEFAMLRRMVEALRPAAVLLAGPEPDAARQTTRPCWRRWRTRSPPACRSRRRWRRGRWACCSAWS